jgi:hypothetical protein
MFFLCVEEGWPVLQTCPSHKRLVSGCGCAERNKLADWLPDSNRICEIIGCYSKWICLMEPKLLTVVRDGNGKAKAASG